MALQAVCPNCETGHKLADEKLGKKIRCKSCKEPFTVEAEEKAKPAGGGVVEVACPHCEARLRLRPEMLGKKVRCKKCQEAFTAKTDGDDEDDEEQKKTNTKVTATPPKGKASAARKKDDDDDDEDDKDEENDDDDDDDDPKSKKGKKKKKAGSPVMMYSIAGGVGVLLVIVVVVVIMMTRGGGETKTPVVAQNDSAKTDDKKKADGNKIVNPPKTEPAKDDKNPLATDKKDEKTKTVYIPKKGDLVPVHLKRLTLDVITNQKEINDSIAWFSDDPKKEKLNHPLRREIADAFQLLVDRPQFENSDICWICYTDWVVSDDEEVKQLEVHLTRAPKGPYKEMILKACARINSDESARVVAGALPSAQHKLAKELLLQRDKKRPLNFEMDKSAKYVFPFVWYNDLYVRDAARVILADYEQMEFVKFANRTTIGLPSAIDKKEAVVSKIPAGDFLKTFIGYKKSKDIPRLPVSKHEMSLEKAIEDMKGDDRLQKLAALDFLQRKTLVPGQWEDVAKVLDPWITDRKDQFMRTNALIALERWAHKTNVANLVAGVDIPALQDDHLLMLTALAKVPDVDSGKAVVALFDKLKLYPEYRRILVEPILKLADEDAQRDLLKMFNAKDGACMSLARQGILKFQKENKRITDDDIIEQCQMDMNGEEIVSLNALGWLKTSTFHTDRKKRSDMLESLATMAKDTSKEGALKAGLARDVISNITAKLSAAGVK